MRQDDGAPSRYAIRILPRAERDIALHTVRLADSAGADIARSWYEGLFDLVATLSQDPRRFVMVNESGRFSREVRQVLYRRAPGGPAWRVLFTVTEGPEDAPTVNLLHVRHGAQRPVTRAEARQIESQE